MLTYTKGYGVDKLFECSGAVQALNQGLPLVKKKGTFVQVGIFSEKLNLLDQESSSLSVSKNTVLRDMKYTQKIVNGYHLEIVYSRMYGYDIVGSEWNKRSDRDEEARV